MATIKNKIKNPKGRLFAIAPLLLLIYILLGISCEQTKTAQNQTNAETKSSKPIQKNQTLYGENLLSPPPISQFVRRIFQDSSDNLWLGTNGDGVLRYDGNSLSEYSIAQGFGGLAVRGILEDKKGNIWFGTERGLVKYDGSYFTNYNTEDGLAGDNVWSLMLDNTNQLWIGTLNGVSRYDGKTFHDFPLPETETDPLRGVSSPKNVRSIMQDREGNLWFGTGGGAFIYDVSGKNPLRNLSEKDGLSNNGVNDILEDQDGNIWFATHHKGVSRYDGKTFTNFTADGLIQGDEVWSIFEDSKGNIWFPAENVGVYRYNGTSFSLFNEENGLGTNAVQSIYETKDGRIWFGGYNGLFRLEGDRIVSVTATGPW